MNLMETSLNLLTLSVPIQHKEINLNFYFHTSLLCLKRFFKGFKGPQLIVKLIFILTQLSKIRRAGTAKHLKYFKHHKPFKHFEEKGLKFAKTS